jgi:hypothetical protein
MFTHKLETAGFRLPADIFMAGAAGSGRSQGRR